MRDFFVFKCMKRYLYIFVLAILTAIGAVAQTPVSSVPYFCGFEDVAENANWVLNRRGGLNPNMPLPSYWTINTGAKHSGIYGLYVYTTAEGGTESESKYDGSQSVFTVAERTFSLPAGSYDLAFDWRCLGDTVNDAIFVYWIPASTSMTARTTSTLPTNATPLTFGTKNFLSGSGSWQQERVGVTISGSQTYKLVFVWRNNTTNTYNPSGCIDNVQLQIHETAEDCWKSVTNLNWEQGSTKDRLSWRGTPGATYDIIYWLEGSVTTDTIKGLTSTSYDFNHGVLASGLYCFAVRTNCDDMQSILVECLNAKSLGDFSMVAEACPEVDLKASVSTGGEKHLYPACSGDGTFTIKPDVVAGGGSIAGYRVDQVPYSGCPFPFDINQLPPQYRNQITTIDRDDYWDTQLINLPFAVCFFDGVYRQALVGANGLVTFDPSIHPNTYCEWDLQSQPDIPSANFLYKNCIMGVYQDYYPVPSAGGAQEIWYGVLGEWPCRKMVVCWNEVPMYGNHSTINSSMIVMYEGTNVIDVYVKNRDLSPSGWNDNIGIIGLINADGTDGIAAPGRNTKDNDVTGRSWSGRQEAWRFTPYSTPTYLLTWYKGIFTDPAQIDAYLNEHAEDDISLGAKDSIKLFEDGDIDEVTVRLQYSQCNGDYIDIVDYAHIDWPRTVTETKDTFFCQGKSYRDAYIPYADTAGVYEARIKNVRGCDSVVYVLNLSEKKKVPGERFDTICEGEELIVEGVRLTRTGQYPIAIPYSDCDCDSIAMEVNLYVQDLSHFGLTPVGTVCADDEEMFIGLETEVHKMVYSLLFEEKAKAQGFEDVVNDTINNVSELMIVMPENVRPDIYKVQVELLSMTCGSLNEEVEFMVGYPSSITPIKWNNVIPVLDEAYNGGYQFTRFQWYKNGEPMETETGPYYHTDEELEYGAYYQVALTRMGDDYAIMSCPIYYGSSDVENVSLDMSELAGPGVKKVIRNGHLYIINNNKVYTVLGTGL